MNFLNVLTTEAPRTQRKHKGTAFGILCASFVFFVPLLCDAEPAEVDYLREVKPLLASHCFNCHGAIKQKGGLRVDTAVFLREGGDNGPAILPGKGDASLLITHVLGKDGLKRMPPEDDSDALKPAQVALLKRWIDGGATAPADEKPETDPKDHWAFKAPLRPAAPNVKNQAWVRNPIDALIAQQHEEIGIIPQPPVEKGLLLRRVYLDLIGIPPTRAELAVFIADSSPNAYEKVVDRLLASPQYGERWGRHWMDVWRYSDWWGLGPELRNSQKHIWHWRDWIVDSLNKDKGYDRMVLEMLAADELYPTDADALRGTGFLARHYFKFNRTTWLDETIEHTSKAFLGLTMNCAKCHDHKYDPLAQVDYYRFRAFFEPYQIRLDQAPGEIDFEKNGVPRVFDCNLDTPTFLHVRGNEQSPNKERAITPGLPKLLAPTGLNIQPVSLPLEAYNPGVRPFVATDHLRAAEKKLTAAREQLEKAKEQLTVAEKQPAPAKPAADVAKTLVRDDFKALNAETWITTAGAWQIEAGKLVQKQTGANRAALSLKQAPPTDFEARVKFAILGGDVYRSVGIAFDVGGSNEALVYLTAHAPEQRVQFAYKQEGDYVYPPDAKSSRKVPLNEPHEMAIRVRGTLLNVLINGQHAFAYEIPKGRHPGRLDLITFDATARMDEFTLATLPVTTQLIAAGNKPNVTSAVQARFALPVAEKLVAAAAQHVATLNSRMAADRGADTPHAKELARQAASSEKQLAVAEAELALARAAEKGDATIKQAGVALDAAKKALANPGETYTPLAGALKTLESNLETEASRGKPFPKVSTGRRTALAKWVADRSNPLTARVAVNHIWTRHFGQPLVPSVFDFGRKGTPPTHPALLDYLAVEFMDSGWSMKHLHRLMVTSSTYRMSSSLLGSAEANRQKDPDHRTFWRMSTSRMESQVVRDSLLSLAGELDLTLGGPSVETAQQETSRRRSIYFFHSAIERNRFLTAFDDADPFDCYRRRESIVPQQALALENSKLALTTAERIASRLDPKLSDRDFATEAFLTVLASSPDDIERLACEEALERWRGLFPNMPAAEATRRARTQLVLVLLNHNDFITVR